MNRDLTRREKCAETLLGEEPRFARNKAETKLRGSTRLARREVMAGAKHGKTHGSTDPGQPYLDLVSLSRF